MVSKCLYNTTRVRLALPRYTHLQTCVILLLYALSLQNMGDSSSPSLPIFCSSKQCLSSFYHSHSLFCNPFTIFTSSLALVTRRFHLSFLPSICPMSVEISKHYFPIRNPRNIHVFFSKNKYPLCFHFF